jgi:hypothetical protein
VKELGMVVAQDVAAEETNAEACFSKKAWVKSI